MHARRFQAPRELERRLTAELHDHALGALTIDDLENVLEGERLEVQLVRGIEVRGDRFGIRVDHDRLEALLPQRDGGADAAVIELHALANTIRSAAEDDHRSAATARRFVLLVVAAVEIRRRRGELTGTSVHHFVCRPNA